MKRFIHLPFLNTKLTGESAVPKTHILPRVVLIDSGIWRSKFKLRFLQSSFVFLRECHGRTKAVPSGR